MKQIRYDRIRQRFWHRLFWDGRGPFILAIVLVAFAFFAWQSRALLAQEIAPAAVPEAGDEVQVSPYLSAQLARGAQTVPILIVLKDQPDLVALQAAAAAISAGSPASAAENRTARATYLYHELTTHATQSQTELRAWLEANGVPYRAHYIVNMIGVTGDAALVEALRLREDVARLDANPQVNTIHVESISTNFASVARWARVVQMPEMVASPNTPYGVAATRAPEVWAMGYTGQGITVASQDTGVQWDHPALQRHYRGTGGDTVEHIYNWLDAIVENGSPDGCAGLAEPCDDNGHGTHTVGTMVGSSDVITYGIAPGAQWMGCRNMRSGVGTPETYTTCFEFFLAPYPPGGDPFTDGRPELAPHIINNSWGCPPSEGCNKDSLRQVVETVRAAGIMVVASAGNNGASGCSSVVDPIAIYDATFSVGAHDSGGNIASFSSKGPVTVDGSGRLKPDLTAPGVGVLSTYRFGGTTTLSGTSMAAPHVAGAVALLWSAAPYLVGEIDLTEQVLLKSAIPANSMVCSDGAEMVSPNPAFGYGRLDVAAAVEMAMQAWSVTVTVTDSMGLPVAGAELTWIDARTGYTRSVMTDAAGTATIVNTFEGEYTLQVRGSAGTVQSDPITLEDEGTGGDLAMHLDVLYDQTVTPTPSRHYLPGIFMNR